MAAILEYCVGSRNCNISLFSGGTAAVYFTTFLFSCRMNDRRLFFVLIFAYSRIVNGEWLANQTAWHPCSLFCNCSLLDDSVMAAKCDLKLNEKPCGNFILPDDALIL